MRTLVLGGIRSGKSKFAETLIGDGPARYIATGGDGSVDSAWARRIDAHRDRRPPSWKTVETADVATELRSAPDAPTMVDDIGGWLTTVLDRQCWDKRSIVAQTEELVSVVRDFPAPLVLVSLEVGMSVVPATESGRRFADELGTLNQYLAECCDRVVLVVAGLPVWLKPANMEATP